MRQQITHLLNKHKNITDLYNALIKFKLFYKDKKEFDRQLNVLCDESVMNELKSIKEV